MAARIRRHITTDATVQPHHGPSTNTHMTAVPKRTRAVRTGIPILAFESKTSKTYLMDTATLSSKGQLVIPRKIRRSLHLEPGDKITFTLEGQRIVLEPQRASRARLGKKGNRSVLIAPPDAPAMTPDSVKGILADFP
ncbi:MAG: AbrB/MazE/SpoVT family DNA-binding domain-containing protein [Terrimicrobiaceae bacterium]